MLARVVSKMHVKSMARPFTSRTLLKSKDAHDAHHDDHHHAHPVSFYS